jgi:hypothetical protein
MALKAGQQHLSQFANARFVVRVTDVDDFTVAAVIFVFDDAEQRFDTVADIRKAAFLFPPSISLIGEPSTRFRISWVIARELPIRAAFRLSRRGPSS